MKIKFYYFIIFFCPFFRVNQFCKADEYPILETTEQSEIEICKKFSDKIKGYYNNEKKYKFKDEEIKNVSSKYFDDLFRIVNFDSSFGKYNKHLAKHYFFISFGIFILFIWFAYNILLIFHKFPHLEFTKKYLKFILFFISIVLYLTIFILSVIGAVNTDKIKNNIDEIKCYFVLFDENYKKGNKIYINNENEYWYGSQNIISLMDYINKSLYNISNSVINKDYENFDGFSKAINDSLTSYKEDDIKYHKFEIIDYDYENENDSETNNTKNFTLSPEYSQNWKEYYLMVLNKTLFALKNNDKNIKDNITTFSYNYKNINNSFIDINIILKNITNITETLYYSTIEPWLIYQEDKYKKNKIVLNIFIFLSIFCLLIIILEILFFYLILNESTIKIIFHVIWNLLNFLLIPTFIFGGIYGIYGTIAKDYSVVINEIFCQESLNNIYNRIYPKYHNLTIFYNILYGNYNFIFNDTLTYVRNINSFLNEINSYSNNYNILYNNISNMNNLIEFYYKNSFYYNNNENIFDISKLIKIIKKFFYNNNLDNEDCIKEIWTNETSKYENSIQECNNEAKLNESCYINLYKIDKYNIPNRYENIKDDEICSYKNKNFESLIDFSKHYKEIFEIFNNRTILPNIAEEQKYISQNFTNINFIFKNSIKDLYNNIDLLSKSTNISYLKNHIKIMIENLNNGYGNRYIRIENIFISIGFILLITQIISIFAINNEQSITYYDKNK